MTLDQVFHGIVVLLGGVIGWISWGFRDLRVTVAELQVEQARLSAENKETMRRFDRLETWMEKIDKRLSDMGKK